VTEPVEIDHWCGKDEAHPPHGGCNGFGMHAGPGRQPAPQPLPKHNGPRRSSRTGAIRRQCFPPSDEQAAQLAPGDRAAVVGFRHYLELAHKRDAGDPLTDADREWLAVYENPPATPPA
jgi:hypothetical protein